MVDLIKPSELDPAASVDADAALVIDNAGQVLKATPVQVVDAGAPVPTQAEAIAGTDNVMRMTPLTTRQVLDNEVAPSVLRAQAWAESATAPDPLLPDSKSSKTWAQIATAAGEVVSITSGAGFPTRADFAVAISTGALDGLSDGQVVSAAGLQYVKKVGSTVIPDLNNWEPSGVVQVGHFNGNISNFSKYNDSAISRMPAGTIGSSVSISLGDSGSVVEGAGWGNTKLVRTFNAGSFLNASNMSWGRLANMTIDLGVGDGFGHVLRGENVEGLHLHDLKIRGYTSDGVTGGGTGIMLFASDPINAPIKYNRLTDIHFTGNDTGLTMTSTFGWLAADHHYGFMSHLFSERALGTTAYAHELKEKSKFNNLHALTSDNSMTCLAYGQSSAGDWGAEQNIATGIIAARTDVGMSLGEAHSNLTLGLLHSPVGGPGIDTPYAIRYVVGSSRNVSLGVLSTGGSSATGQLTANGSENNFTQLFMTGNVNATIREINGSGARKNVTEVGHPGNRLTIKPYLIDTTGNNTSGTNANPIYCHATGEYFCTLSGSFHWSHANNGISWNSGHSFRMEGISNAFLAMGTPDTSGASAGFIHSTPASNNRGSILSITGATIDDDIVQIRTAATNVIRFAKTLMRPILDASYSFGTSSFRFLDVFSQRLRPGAGAVIWTSGAGTPEGSVSAPVGSLYTNTSGAAGTTLYVKESGTGNTGWAAK